MSAWDIQGETVMQPIETTVTTGAKYIGGTAAATAMQGNPNYAGNPKNWVIPIAVIGALGLIGLLIFKKA